MQLAQAAVKDGGAPYGAVIVDPEKNEIIVQGNNHASSNPIWHGEMDALNKLAGMVEKEGLTVYQVAPKLELYTSAEPCSMCMSALAWSGIGRVYYGTSIPFIASQGLNQISIRAPRSRLDAGTWGTMGVGMGQAIAAALVNPDPGCLAVFGDSAFGFSGMEFETIWRLQLPVAKSKIRSRSACVRFFFPAQQPIIDHLQHPKGIYDVI